MISDGVDYDTEASDSSDARQEAVEAEDSEAGVREASGRQQEAYYPEITGFDDSSPLSEDGVKEALGKLPPEHVENVRSRVDRIEYVDETRLDDNGRVIEGEFNPEERKLSIYRQQQGENANLTLYHECGHPQYQCLSPAQQDAWYRIYYDGGEREQVTPHIVKQYDDLQRPEEDFSESYAYYVESPEVLLRRSPRKYLYMKSQAFQGEAYLHPVDESRNLHDAFRDL